MKMAGVFALGFVFLSAGLALGYYGARTLVFAFSSSRWPGTEGLVTKSELAEYAGTRSSRSYRADIAYTYTVNGTRHTGGRVRLGSTRTSHASDAEAIQDKYPVGKSVTVYYDPAKPGEAMLEPGLVRGVWLLPGLGLLFLLSGVFILSRGREAGAGSAWPRHPGPTPSV
jgi:hypothetical protein